MKDMELRLGSQKQSDDLGNSVEKEMCLNLYRERRKRSGSEVRS